MFGSSTCSAGLVREQPPITARTEVWSNTWEQTYPPRLQGRCDDHRYAKAEAQRISPNRARRMMLSVLFHLHILEGRVEPLRLTRPRFQALLGMGSAGKRRNVIEIAVVLIVSQDEYRLPPDFGVLGQDVEDFRQIPLAVPRRRRVIGEAAPAGRRATKRWEGCASVHILAKLMQDVALRHLASAAAFVAVLVGDFR